MWDSGQGVEMVCPGPVWLSTPNIRSGTLEEHERYPDLVLTIESVIPSYASSFENVVIQCGECS
jgi:hypothetical protein